MKRIWARLKVHWVRHLLAAVQVALGVAVISAVILDVMPALRAAGEWRRRGDAFFALYGDWGPMGGSMRSAFTTDDLDYLLREAGAIAAATFFESALTNLIQVDGELYAVRGVAEVSPGLAGVTEVPLLAGRFFTDADVKAPEPLVALISAELAEMLFPGRDPVGQTINLRPESEATRLHGFPLGGAAPVEGAPGLDLTVIGVFAYPEGTPTYTGFFAEAARAEILLPATGKLSPSLAPVRPAAEGGSSPGARLFTKEYTRLYFRAVEGMGAEAVEEVRALLGPRLEEQFPVSGPQDWATLQVEPAESAAAFLIRSRFQSALVLGAMGVVALIVSGFSIFTTLLASVAERVRAIGLARSLGATRLRILGEVVGEAVMLSAFGGLIGVVLAYPVRRFALLPLLADQATAVAAVDHLLAALAGLLAAAAIGAVASLYPGWTVARMMPAEAFHEA